MILILVIVDIMMKIGNSFWHVCFIPLALSTCKSSGRKVQPLEINLCIVVVLSVSYNKLYPHHHHCHNGYYEHWQQVNPHYDINSGSDLLWSAH